MSGKKMVQFRIIIKNIQIDIRYGVSLTAHSKINYSSIDKSLEICYNIIKERYLSKKSFLVRLDKLKATFLVQLAQRM